MDVLRAEAPRPLDGIHWIGVNDALVLQEGEVAAEDRDVERECGGRRWRSHARLVAPRLPRSSEYVEECATVVRRRLCRRAPDPFYVVGKLEQHLLVLDPGRIRATLAGELADV